MRRWPRWGSIVCAGVAGWLGFELLAHWIGDAEATAVAIVVVLLAGAVWLDEYDKKRMGRDRWK